MHRYHMTAETREALIAESRRLIAARAERQASRKDGSCAPREDAANDDCNFQRRVGDRAGCSDIAFARLVSDLESKPVVALRYV